MFKRYTLLLIVLCLVFALSFTGCKLTEKAADSTTPASTYDPDGLWATSGHADSTAEAFRHWDEDDPPMVPTGCAKCHSNDGFIDFVADGVVDSAANPGVLSCDVCHAGGSTRDLQSVTFPSGRVIGGLGTEAICMQCHQGRASKFDVDAHIAGRNPAGEDAVTAGLSFRNIHYFPAGATMMGTFARGGYEYDGMMYDARNYHVEGYSACADCHDPHSLQIKRAECTACHTGLSVSADAKVQGGHVHDIRWKGSLTDYDGDGDISEGIYYELVTLSEYLYNAMWKYSKDVTGKAIGYNEHAYPYFFVDANENGVIDEGESGRYSSWTPRLLKAAYNYQTFKKDPGSFAHGGKYMIQLLYDSLMDVNGASPNPLELPALKRGDEGHFDGSAEAWRHWDADGEVSASCAKCHSAEGLPHFLKHGETEEAKLSNGLMCSTCHTTIPALHKIDYVKFPSGDQVSLGDGSNLCLNCHQGRASKHDVDAKIGNASSGTFSFTNIHYFPAAAVHFGTEVKGGYEYPNKSYVGRKLFLNHGDNFDTCVECHMGVKGADSAKGHNVMSPNPQDCVVCHGRDVSQPNPGRDPALFSFEHIRPDSVPDYDGDGNVEESLKDEIKGLEDALYYQLRKDAMMRGNPLVYDSHSYPYFFKDKNGNGILDPDEANRSNGYRFTANQLKAAYNYQMSLKEPHGFIHNSMYVAQLLVDSIGDLGGDVSPYTWR